MRTTIRMNEELARRAKEYAARHDRTFTEVVEEAVIKLLAQAKEPPARRKIVLPTAGTSKSPPMSEADYKALIEEMYEEEAERAWRSGGGDSRR